MSSVSSKFNNKLTIDPHLILLQAWLSTTQINIASEDVVQSLQEAETLVQQHQTIKLEIENYEVRL